MVALVCALALPTALAGEAQREGAARDSVIRFERYHHTDEIRLAFRALAKRYPRWFRCGSLGQSVLGRTIPFLAITDFESTERKTGMWIDGAIHGNELASAEPVLGVAEWVRSELERGALPEFLDRVVLYLVPVINVDGRRVSLESPRLRQRNNLFPVDDDGDGRADEDGAFDVNGDGRIAMMELFGNGGSRPEGGDQDGDGEVGEDPLGGIDLNRNFPVERGPGDTPATPLQVETRAIIDFWEDHPEIQLAVSYHTSANGFVLPPVPISEEERTLYDRVLAVYEKWTGYGEFHLPSGYLRGVSIEWFHTERRALAFVIEIAEAGPPAARRYELFDIEGFGTVRIPRIEPDGYMYADASHLERNLANVVDQHVVYLLEMAELLPLQR